MKIIQKPVQPVSAVLSNPRELRYANEEKTSVDMIINHSQFGDIPFTADANDTEEHGVALFNQVTQDDSFEILEYDLFFYYPDHPDNPANAIPVVEV